VAVCYTRDGFIFKTEEFEGQECDWFKKQKNSIKGKVPSMPLFGKYQII